MSTIDDLSTDDARRLAHLVGQEWSDDDVARLLPQVKAVLTAAKRVYDLDLGTSELAVSFELAESDR